MPNYEIEKIYNQNIDLFLNNPIQVENYYTDKCDLVDLDNKKISFYNTEHPIISTKNIKALIYQDQFIHLYSFNQNKESFKIDYNIDSVKKI